VGALTVAVRVGAQTRAAERLGRYALPACTGVPDRRFGGAHDSTRRGQAHELGVTSTLEVRGARR
jgi:hypothetical protein